MGEKGYFMLSVAEDSTDGGHSCIHLEFVIHNKGSSINYVIADRGGGVSPKDYGIT